jgi:class 3 adenylate cyclase
LSDERVERRLAAILAADVAGYSRLMGSNEEGTLAQLKTIRKAFVDPTIAIYGQVIGDKISALRQGNLDALAREENDSRATCIPLLEAAQGPNSLAIMSVNGLASVQSGAYSCK